MYNYNYNIQYTKTTNVTNKLPQSKNCVVFIHKQDDNETDIELENNIRYILNKKNHQVIGDKSSNAYALLINGYKKDNVVIKVPRKRENKGFVDSLEYEYLVGIYLKNHIDKNCVNFQKVYGYIKYKCSETNKKTNKQISEEYLAIERIKPGISFRQFFDPDIFMDTTVIKKKTPPKNMNKLIKSLLLQVYCSLAYAQSCCGYVHYDLHFGNVLIRKLTAEDNYDISDYNGDDSSFNETGYIDYTFYPDILNVIKLKEKQKKNKNDDVNIQQSLTTFRVPIINNYVSTIIDYGRSRVAGSFDIFKKKPELLKPYDFLKEKKVYISEFDPLFDSNKFNANIVKFIRDKNGHVINIPNTFNTLYDVIIWFDEHMII